ncbi:MAG: patatin-like phospholipase family protein, partial [Spirochaetales bacterium]|nr:patatin-like phospholipase family protein [Spirochaetales bacterium]
MTLPKYLLLFITALFVLFPAGAQEIPASEAGSPDESDGTDTPVIALVLQGGGALGIAHIAVIDEIERLGIPIDMVVGTSMGAIVGGLYSAGYTPAELEALIGDTDWMQLFIPDPPYYKKSIHQRYDESRYISFSFSRTGESTARGLISDRNILAYMDRLTLDFPDNMDFDTLPRKFRAVALDINTSEKVVIGEGSLTDAMRASMGIPGFFAPYELDGSILVDGGVVDNLPIEVARDLGADYIIAVQLSGGMDYTPEELKSSPLSSVARAIDLLLYQNVKHQLDMADFVLDIDLTGYQPADFGKGDEILERGRIAVEESADGFLKVRDEVLAFGTSSELREYPVPPVAGVRIEGASARDLKRIEPLLKPFEGNYPDEEIIESVLNELTANDHYETVRISRELTGEGESDLVLSLKKNNRTNSFNVGVLSGSTYSGNVMSREVFSG